jgi:GTP-binding protein
MFVDQAKIFVRGGQGGNGCMSFRREKFIPRGGPDGGNGGDGGSVIIRSDAALQTLLDLRYHSFSFASSGQHGKGKDMQGRRGEDLHIRVPLGTLVYDAETQEILCDLQHHGEECIVARGGRGGRGNASFATSTNRAPRRTTPASLAKNAGCWWN